MYPLLMVFNRLKLIAHTTRGGMSAVSVAMACGTTATVILLSACSPRSDSRMSQSSSPAGAPVSQQTEVRSEETAVAIRGLKPSGPAPSIKRELVHLDPSVDDWDSEVFSDAASQQLKRLAVAIASRTEVDRGILDPSFACGALRQENMNEVFDDGVLRVARATFDAESAPHFTWDEAFKQLIRPLAADSQLRMQFKIVHVELDGDEAKTEVHTHLVAEASHLSVQQNAVWDCRWIWPDRKGAPRLLRILLRSFEEVQRNSKQSVFVDSTQSVLPPDKSLRGQFARGIDDWRRRIDRRFGIEVIGPHGLAVGDANGDGLDDLYVCEPGGLPNRLLLQEADGSTRDVSARAAVDYLEPTHSALFIDLDNDQDQDLVLAVSRYILFLSNEGDATYTRRQMHATPSVSRSLAAADFDSDGDVDVYVCGYFARDPDENGIGLGRPMPYHDANNGSENTLLANDGEWQFRDVTKRTGLNVNNRRFSYAASWADYDRDGDQDLYVANDFGRNNLYRNDGGHFQDVASIAGVEDISAGMSVGWADYNRDGWLDVYVGNMFSSAGNRVTYQRHFGADDSSAVKSLYQRHARGNSLFRNAGDGSFADVTLNAGVNLGRWAWGCNFVDLNNDGWEDLVVGNGMVTSRDDNGDL